MFQLKDNAPESQIHSSVIHYQTDDNKIGLSPGGREILMTYLTNVSIRTKMDVRKFLSRQLLPNNRAQIINVLKCYPQIYKKTHFKQGTSCDFHEEVD